MNTKGPNHQWIKYGLTRRISASENFPRHYQEYLALGNEICKDISFKDYFYCIFGFWPKRANEDMLKKNRPLGREMGCSTTQNRKEEGKGTKGQGLPKPSIYWSFMRSFVFIEAEPNLVRTQFALASARRKMIHNPIHPQLLRGTMKHLFI